jgi:hypothetical protein
MLKKIRSRALIATLYFLALFGAPMLAIASDAGGPHDLSGASRYLSPQGTVRGVRVLCPSASTAMIPYTSGGSQPWILPYGGLLTFTGGGNMTVCLHQAYTADVSIGDQTTSAATTLTDASGPDGNATCFTLRSAGSFKDEIPKYQNLSQAPGARTGICSAPTNNQVASMSFYGHCRQDTDCTNGGAPAGTMCLTAPSDAQLAVRLPLAGVYATCRASVDQTDLTVVYER